MEIKIHNEFINKIKRLDILLKKIDDNKNELCNSIYNKSKTVICFKLFNYSHNRREYIVSINKSCKNIDDNNRIIKKHIDDIRIFAKKHIYKECVYIYKKDFNNIFEKYNFEFKKFTSNKDSYDINRLLDEYKTKIDPSNIKYLDKIYEYILENGLCNIFSYNVAAILKNYIYSKDDYICFYTDIKKMLNSMKCTKIWIGKNMSSHFLDYVFG